MHQSKFITLLKSLSREEIKEFNKLLISPYFNTNKSLVKAYDIIKADYPDFSSEKLKKEYLFKKIYGNKPYADANMRYISSELLRLGEEFLALTNIRNRKVEYKKYLLAEANERCLDKIFERNLKLSKEMAEELNPNDANYYKINYEILSEEGKFSTRRMEFLTEGIEDRTGILTRMYILEILKEYRLLLNQKVYIKNQYPQIPFADEVMDYVLKNNFLDVPGIGITCYQILSIKERENEEHYFRLKELTEKYINELSSVEKYNSYTILLNYANQKLGEGHENFRNEVFDLHKSSAKNNAITKGGVIAPLRFEAIVTDALRLKEYDWIDGFMLNYKHMLPAEERDAMVYYCLARISYSKKENEKALEYLSGVNFNSHIILNIRKRNLAVKLYYELDYLDTLASYIDTYRHYLTSHEKLMPPRAYEYYMNFVKIFPELIKLKSMPRRDKVDMLKLKLEKNENINEKQWIMKMLNMIGGGNVYERKV